MNVVGNDTKTPWHVWLSLWMFVAWWMAGLVVPLTLFLFSSEYPFLLQLVVAALWVAVGICLLLRIPAAWYLAVGLAFLTLVYAAVHAGHFVYPENGHGDPSTFIGMLVMYVIAVRYLTLPRIRALFGLGS